VNGAATGTASAGSTTVDWQFPLQNQGDPGAARIDANFRVRKPLLWDAGQHQYRRQWSVLLLDATGYSNGTTKVKWFYNGARLHPFTKPGRAVAVNTGDFRSSPAVVPFSTIYPVAPGQIPAGRGCERISDRWVWCMHNNGYVYAFEAVPNLPNGSVGSLSRTPRTNLTVGAVGGISFTMMDVFNNTGQINLGAGTPVPVMLIPTWMVDLTRCSRTR